MKFLKPFIFSILFLSGLSVYAQNKDYQIEGTFNNPAGITKLYFTQGNFMGQANTAAREIAVKNGKFSISGKISEPVPVFLSLTEKFTPNGADSKQFILDAGKITVLISGALNTATISGSKAQDDVQKYTAAQAVFVQKFNRLNAEAQQAAQAGEPAESLQKRFMPAFKEAQQDLMSFQKTFIGQNPQAFISLLVIPELAQLSQDYVQADSLFNLLSAPIKGSETGKAIHGFVSAQKKTSLGAMAPEFALADTSGNKIPLSSLKGKYVLLDFWASWCGPCRDENPNVVQAYQKFKDKGFTVFGVSLDRDRKSWINAIKADNLTWGHVSDLKYWSSEAALLYGISSIPRNFLLDPQGKIIARDLRGPALIEKLTEIFTKKN